MVIIIARLFTTGLLLFLIGLNCVAVLKRQKNYGNRFGFGISFIFYNIWYCNNSWDGLLLLCHICTVLVCCHVKTVSYLHIGMYFFFYITKSDCYQMFFVDLYGLMFFFLWGFLRFFFSSAATFFYFLECNIVVFFFFLDSVLIIFIYLFIVRCYVIASYGSVPNTFCNWFLLSLWE